jgi:two-component system cell cycle response regulator
MVDIDKFKEINDNYGHAAGDGVLRHLAQILQQKLRKIDIICRYGGDEFVVVMPDTSGPAAEEIRSRIMEAVHNLESPAPMSYEVSIGVYSGHPASASEIFASADFDMYREKSSKIDAEIDNLSQNIGDFLDEEEGETRPERDTRPASPA